MDSANAIEVRDLTKSFKVYLDKGSQLKERVLFRERNRFEERQILRGVSFSVKKGEAIGLIGHNGCGKSTTLKLLTRIIYPNSGTVEMCGRVSSLIELGAGFHPDMSGRENIYTNAAIFGLTKKEIDERMDDIIAFSELEEYLDNPVRTYSSGMYMRLAFSVAINVDADILLIDEILAVGDANFQAKCFNRLREIKASGTTIVIVSHSLGQIEQICDRSIWIHNGEIRADGAPRDVHPEYLSFMGEERQKINEKEKARRTGKVGSEETEAIQEAEQNGRWGNGHARIRQVRMLDSSGKEKAVFSTGEPAVIQVDYRVYKEVKDAVFGIGIFRRDGIHCYGTNTRLDNIPRFDLTADGCISIELDKLQLLPGEYLLDVAIESELGIPVDYYREVLKFEMFSVLEDVGVVRLEHTWRGIQ